MPLDPPETDTPEQWKEEFNIEPMRIDLDEDGEELIKRLDKINKTLSNIEKLLEKLVNQPL